jgi:hypothetical protein
VILSNTKEFIPISRPLKNLSSDQLTLPLIKVQNQPVSVTLNFSLNDKICFGSKFRIVFEPVSVRGAHHRTVTYVPRE